MEPIKFKPIFKQTIWGGDKIARFKHIDSSEHNIGESWELSGVENMETVIANGLYEGKTLSEAVGEMKHELLGEDNYKKFGNEFPLLVKFIDAGLDLSIQVHPDDEMARKHGFKNGKTEMWYLMESDENAKIYCGLKQQLTPELYKQMVAEDTICEAIAVHEAKADDCFFIPAGRIHSIGKGCFLVEIQQTSDTTYRIYDFKRKDKDGNYRELHTEKAAECIHYDVEKDYRTSFVPMKNEGVSLVECDLFNVAVYDLNEPMTLDYTELDSFVILVGVKGEGCIVDNEGNETSLNEGETILIPATTEFVNVSGNIKFLETYI